MAPSCYFALTVSPLMLDNPQRYGARADQDPLSKD